MGAGPLDGICREEAARLNLAVAFTGFVNQTGLLDVLGATDCLVLPSDGRETWGLVVNEAMAAGVPAIVSDRVGCQPDLVLDGVTGAVFPLGDVGALRGAIERVAARRAAGHDFAPACRAQVERHGFAHATEGLVAACSRLAYRARSVRINRDRATQVLACCGHMVTPGGLERMTFEVLATLHHHHAGVHCLVNRWGSSRIVALAERAGAAWSIGRSDEPLRRRPSSLAATLRMTWEIFKTSVDVLAARFRLGATHILVPDFLVTVRAWPALALLRVFGCRVILRVGMAPPAGDFYRTLWKWIVNPAVDRMICNSEFLYREVERLGVPARKLRVIPNAAVPRGTTAAASEPCRVVYVGQVIPDKGIDILLAAVAELRQEGMPATLDVVGDMSEWESPPYRGYRSSLRAMAAQPALDGAVRFLGYREDVGTVMASAAVHCCPSREAIREGMANVVLEAKAAGVPSVVTRSGSLPELVDHRVDGWIAGDDATSIAAGLRHFLEDASVRQRAGLAARRSLERFGREEFDRNWLAEFDLAPASHLCQATRATT